MARRKPGAPVLRPKGSIGGDNLEYVLSVFDGKGKEAIKELAAYPEMLRHFKLHDEKLGYLVFPFSARPWLQASIGQDECETFDKALESKLAAVHQEKVARAEEQGKSKPKPMFNYVLCPSGFSIEKQESRAKLVLKFFVQNVRNGQLGQDLKDYLKLTLEQAEVAAVDLSLPIPKDVSLDLRRCPEWVMGNGRNTDALMKMKKKKKKEEDGKEMMMTAEKGDVKKGKEMMMTVEKGDVKKGKGQPGSSKKLLDAVPSPLEVGEDSVKEDEQGSSKKFNVAVPPISSQKLNVSPIHSKKFNVAVPSPLEGYSKTEDVKEPQEESSEQQLDGYEPSVQVGWSRQQLEGYLPSPLEGYTESEGEEEPQEESSEQQLDGYEPSVQVGWSRQQLEGYVPSPLEMGSETEDEEPVEVDVVRSSKRSHVAETDEEAASSKGAKIARTRSFANISNIK